MKRKFTADQVRALQQGITPEPWESDQAGDVHGGDGQRVAVGELGEA